MHHYKNMETCSRSSAFEGDCIENKAKYHGERDFYEKGALILEITYVIFVLFTSTLVFIMCLIHGIQDAQHVRGRLSFTIYGIIMTVGLILYNFQYRVIEDHWAYALFY